MSPSLHRKAAVACLLIGIAIPCAARADVGVPMLALVWPAAWLLLLVIIPVEGWFARRMLALPWSRALSVSAVANLVATLVGIPLVWFLLLLVEFGLGWMMSTGFVPETPPPEALVKAVAITLMAPWLGPGVELQPWIAPAAAAYLCIPFYLASVFCENHVVRRRLREHDPARIRRWAWVANGFSYGIAFLVLVTLAIATALRPARQ